MSVDQKQTGTHNCHLTSVRLGTMSGEVEIDYLEIWEKRGIAALDQKLGIVIIEASPQRVVATMPVEGNTQPLGFLHGGANVVLAESLGSIGTALHAGPHRKVVGVDINATHHRTATQGLVTGVATPVSLGRTLCCYEIVITNEAGQRTCTARITCMILAER